MKLKYISGIFLLAAGLTFATSCNDDDYDIATGELVTSITTGEAAYTAISADITGTVTGLASASSSSYEVGVYYSVNSNPTAGTKVKGSLDGETISASLSGLTPGTTYYYCTYVLLQGQVFRYGDVRQFIATDAVVATADAPLANTATTMTIVGQYQGTEGVDATLGVYVATDEQNVTSGTFCPATEVGDHQFTTLCENLLPSTTYYYCAATRVGNVEEYGDVRQIDMPDQTMEYVDLGLSVCWAVANIGGEVASQAGQSFSYAEASHILDDIIIDADGNYISALPTKAEITELISHTTQSADEVNGVKGTRFTASNGNSIFLPYANYWSSELVATNAEYASTINNSGQTARLGTSGVDCIYAVRPVAQEVVTEGIRIYRSKIVQGDIEGNGNYRVDIYNAWDGSGTGDNPGVNPDDVKFESNMKVTFTISGIQPEGEYQAYMCFADGTWAVQNWGYNESGEASCLVTKDGTYSMTIHGTGAGLGVFALDFVGLSAACGAENLSVRVESIVMDVIEEPGVVRVRQEKLIMGDIENNGNYRIELYNMYGASASDPAVSPDDVQFQHNMQLTFTVQGITTDTPYKCFFVFADGDWNPSNWGYNESGEASCLVQGDGTYTLTFHGAGSGAAVFCVDIAGLSADCGADNISVTVDKLVMDHAGTAVNTGGSGQLAVGDIENNGRIRIEIYNEYGSTKGNSIINPDDIVFSDNMAVTFNITGIDGNLRDGAAGTYVAGLEYSDPTWGVSYWSQLEMTQYEAPVTGDGTYTVWCEVGSKANGAVVFCVDIKDLGSDLIDISKVAAEIVDIRLDATIDQSINPDLNTFQNKDGKGIDGRIEIYNEYGVGGTTANGYYNDDLAFNGMCLVEFTISGIDGNLRDGAAGSYTATMSYAAASWSPSYWGGNDYGNATVTGDGTYQVYAYINGDCYGAVVWTIELYNLWQDLVDTDKVQVSVDKIITPRKL